MYAERLLIEGWCDTVWLSSCGLTWYCLVVTTYCIYNCIIHS